MRAARFRLTPEEQELAYELKANMMRKLDAQNEKLETEILLNEKLKTVKRAPKTTDRPKRFDNMTLTNAVKLMKMYERKAKEGELKGLLLKFTSMYMDVVSMLSLYLM